MIMLYVLKTLEYDHKGVGMWKRERILKKCSDYTQKNADPGLETGHRPGKVKGLVKRTPFP